VRGVELAAGSNAANRELTYIGISGDGDSLSIGLGHMCHAIRRNVKMLYVIENNGVYGLTKGQFSASADVGSKSKRGEPNRMAPIDPVSLGLSIGATFIARSFSGDKEQLVPILKAAFSHNGFALIDVISPCVTFNDHEGSTKSYLHTRQHQLEVTAADFVPQKREITATYDEGSSTRVTMHDGSVVKFTKVAPEYDPSNREAVYSYLRAHQQKGDVPTGLLFFDPETQDMHEQAGTTRTPLSQLPYEKLCPGKAALDKLQDDYT
jgi:2-oxoglutarate ferredoxin oxidoreductase subunit beta